MTHTDWSHGGAGPIRVGVLMGGPSEEREVSLRSGHAVCQGLERAGYEVVPLTVDGELIPAPTLECDVIFPALHGLFGEDGAVQMLLQSAGLPYVGSDPRASALAFDKEATKVRLAEAVIPTPRWCVLGPDTPPSAIPFEPPLVAKPTRQGSSIGITMVERPEDLPAALLSCFAHGERVLVERRVTGRELTVGILDGEVLPAIEIVPPGGVFDYESKYTKGRTRYLCPAPLDPDQAAMVQAAALATWQVLGTRDLGRVDVILEHGDRPSVLEMNTIPGFTETSLLPMAAAEAGIPFPELCSRLVDAAARRAGARVAGDR